MKLNIVIEKTILIIIHIRIPLSFVFHRIQQ
jgi:hypothetical protein